MLVLTRKVGEGIAIGDDVKIIVMQIKGKQVRLGIKAAPATTVHREEIYQKILDENRAAAKSEPANVGKAQDILRAESKPLGQVPIRKYVKGSRGQGSD